MKSGYLLAGASILHAVAAIPAYITTVFHCPDVVTITQTVYPPGWTATGPIYSSVTGQPSPYYPPQEPQTTCTETAPVTTSWETEYATTTVYYSEYGMYSGPPGCPSEIIAYMPTTVTCSEPRTTGWVGYTEDIACASCTATTLVGLEPSYYVSSGVTATYVTVWTEVYIEGGASTWASVVGNTWVATGSIPTNVYPYNKICTGGWSGGGGYEYPQTPTNGGGYEYPAPSSYGGGYEYPQSNTYPPQGHTYTHSPGAYPSIDYNNPDVFRGGESIEIVSQGYTSTSGYYSPAPSPTPAQEDPYQHQGPYTWSKGHYPSIDYNNPDYFKGGSGTGTYSQPPPTNTYYSNTYPNTYSNTYSNTYPNTYSSDPPINQQTYPSGSERPTSYPDNYSNTQYFRPVQSSVGIVSATGPPPSVPVTTTYTAATSYTSNYASIDANNSENFRPLTGGIEIVSLETPQTFAEPTTTATVNPATVRTVAYPSIDYSDPNVFRGLDPNSGAPSATP
ncbi:hypothetical protein ABW19_dt0208439 [Dactylella cylindrospora]|nr:hypothetical protein ABW19_dt0208439 [Dactylella cylindrospora]